MLCDISAADAHIDTMNIIELRSCLDSDSHALFISTNL